MQLCASNLNLIKWPQPQPQLQLELERRRVGISFAVVIMNKVANAPKMSATAAILMNIKRLLIYFPNAQPLFADELANLRTLAAICRRHTPSEKEFA